MRSLRYLLLQIRRPEDPIREQEVRCFASALGCQPDDLATFDLLTERLTAERLNKVDLVLIGGSGDFSAAGQSAWLDTTLADLRQLVDLQKPTFGSCWGFQALARALGGRCINDPDHAELGTISLELTQAGQDDPIFGQLETPFLAQAGHEDHVVALPPGATLLASSATVANQAFKLTDAPIYCTQFHPELERQTFLERVEAYPQYVERIAGLSIEAFAKQCTEAPQTKKLLKRFAATIVSSP